MNRYECHFTDEVGGSKIGMSKLIIAKTPEAAAKEFSNDKTKTNNKYILVAWAGGNPKIILNEEENLIVKEKDNFKNKLELTNSILNKIVNLQEQQISEIKSVQWWMRFGIFMILVQIITAKIKLGL